MRTFHGKDAFHRVPDFARNDWDAVERLPAGKHFWRAQIRRPSRGHARQFTTTNKQQKKVSNV